MPCFARGYATAALLLVATTSSALTINFNYVKPGSDPFVPSVIRPDDPDGARLLAHAEAAADDWSRVIQDNWTMNIELYYADEPIVGTTTASIRPDFQTLEFNGKNRVISGTIRVFDEIDAFYDPTPSEDSEFGAPIESLYRDALPINAATIRVESGDASLLELGYRRPGNSNVSVHEWDLLTIMRHELGHYMGFNQRSPDDPDRDDGDFDVDPDLLGGAKVGITGAGHIHPAGPLMSVTQDPRSRNEISATDFFAAAKGSGWENLHLERVDYLGPASGPTNFTIGTNWTGGAAPDPAAAVSVRNGGLLSVITDEVVDSLVVDRSSQMNLINADLLVAKGLVVGRQSASNDTEGQVSVFGNATLSARSVAIEVGQLGLTLGTLRSRFGAIENDATLTGYGQINTAGGLTNRGTLRATVGTLTITGPALANPVADLDGGNRFAVVAAITGSVDVQIDNDAGFRGRMTIGGGEFVHLPNDWTLGNLGKLQLQGGASQEAELRGGDLTATNAELTVTGRGRIAANLSITSNSDVTVTPTNARLTVVGNLDLNRGTITGAGGLIVQKTLTASNGSIDVEVLTLGQTATIDGASVTASDITGAVRLDEGSLAFDTFQGDLLQQGGFLDAGSKASQVNGDWSQDGGGTLGVQITGDNDFGQLLVSGDVVIDGLIEVDLLGGYEPDLLRSFTIVQAGKLVIESLGLTGPDAQHFELQVSSNTLRLIAVTPLPGDYNDDGMVDAADYTLWRDNVGAPAGTLPNDNAGGSIGTAQYNAWRANFGATLAGSSASTPEPTAFLLSSFALLASACLRRGKVRGH